MNWDKDGDTLAAITEKSNSVYLWSANSQKSNVIDTPPKYFVTSCFIFVHYQKNNIELAIKRIENLLLYIYIYFHS